jgi:hypothetical protein
MPSNDKSSSGSSSLISRTYGHLHSFLCIVRDRNHTNKSDDCCVGTCCLWSHTALTTSRLAAADVPD